MKFRNRTGAWLYFNANSQKNSTTQKDGKMLTIFCSKTKNVWINLKPFYLTQNKILLKKSPTNVVRHTKVTPRYTEIVGYFLNINVKICYCVFTLEWNNLRLCYIKTSKYSFIRQFQVKSYEKNWHP